MLTKTTALLLMSLLAVGTAAAAQESTGTPEKAVPMQKIAPPGAPQQTAAGEAKLLGAGETAPDFVSNDLAGKPVRLSDYKGKTVVLDFWATWCGPCLASLPHTQEVAKKFKADGVVVLAVCTSDTRAKFEEWLKANQSKYPDIVFTCDPNERGSANYGDRASLKLYGVSGIPTQYVINREGKVAASLVGYSAGDTRLESELGKLGIKSN